MIVTAYFSENGLPKIGLSPTVDIIDIFDDSVDINDGAMSEVGQGFYKYDFAGHDSSKNYLMLADSVILTGDERYAIGTLEDDTKIDAVQAQTDKMNFAGDDIKATLDGEEVVTDTVSRNASKADVSGIPTVSEIGDMVIEGTLTLKQVEMLTLAFIAGETTGGGTTEVVFKNQAGDKSRIALTVDENGNRSLTVLDVS